MKEYKTEVLIGRDGEQYFALGVDIDYAAGGATEHETRENFRHGLKRTLELNIERYGTADRFCKPAPQYEIDEFGPKAVRYTETIIV